ncbi:MAG: DEAD/DEAH box helicase family protein, partial [Actinobacteria bacterium]|nr:DEAD/DEAH box helicase family protein [Actinomycetota bacterium]
MSATVDAAVGQVTETNPIINDAFCEPQFHWSFGAGAPVKKGGRRPAGYLPPMLKGGQLQITDELVVMEGVNTIRKRVRDWREGDYQGATNITRELFKRWFVDPEQGRRPFFAQQEAIETIAWLTEAPADRKVGISIPQFEAYERWAIKLATGAGKTLVMCMTIAWSGLNKLANRQDTRFADAVLVVCPNLTVRERLSGLDGLLPSQPGNAYERFNLIPGQFAGLFGQVRVMVTNWHALAEQKDAKRSVVKLGQETDAAFCRRVLRDLGTKKRIMVLNDEAHHAWRPPPNLDVKGDEKAEVEEATIWVDGLARIHRDRAILRCIDYSATPMYPGAVGPQRAFRPFEWIVADFSLVDAIESGLVKVPRIPTTDDSGRSAPKYRNLWEHIKRQKKKALDALEDDVSSSRHVTDYVSEIAGALQQLAGEWETTYNRWTEANLQIPPVMIVVCADTTMAQVIERIVAERGDLTPLLENNGSQNTLRIDTKVLETAEARTTGESQQDYAERLREIVATVGKPGQPGEQVRCLISVGMLSEGWDARNVTQIMGLRAFQSQLLCEQVVGRGLRRTSYDDLSQPEYVDVYGVPFQLLPFARASSATPIEPPETTIVRALPERTAMRIDFPRVEQVIHDVGDVVTIDLTNFEPIVVSPENDPQATYVEFEGGAPGQGLGGQTQDRQRAYERFREQHLAFRIAAELVQTCNPDGPKPWLFPQLVRMVGQVIDQQVTYAPDLHDRRELSNLRYATLIRDRILDALRSSEHQALLPVLNEFSPYGSTEGIEFRTAKDCIGTTRSHLSHAVCDSKLEAGIVARLEADKRVAVYAKNDRLFFEIP